jgi:hypothetical protein
VVWEPVLTTDFAAPSTTSLGRIPDVRASQYWDRKPALSHLRKSEMVAEAVRRATEQGFQNDARMPCTPCAARQALGSAYAGGKRLPCFLRSFAGGDLVRRRRMHVIGTNHRGGLKKR